MGVGGGWEEGGHLCTQNPAQWSRVELSSRSSIFSILFICFFFFI